MRTRLSLIAALGATSVLVWASLAVGDLALDGPAIQVNSETVIAAEVFPSVGAFPNGDFVVTWSENVEIPSDLRPFRSEVMARHYASNGVPFGSEVVVNTYTTGWQGWPVVDTWADGFVIVWESMPFIPGSPEFGGLRRYDAAGTALEGELRFNETANDPVLAVAPDGGFVIAWSDFRGLLTRRFDGAAVPLSDAVRVDEPDVSAYFPAIALLADGSYIVAFQTADPTGIAARRFDEAGQPLGSSFRISQSTRGQAPEIVSQPDGGFVVIWNRSGFVGRRFTADGIPAGEAFALSNRGARHGFPGPRQAASDPTGGFVIVWEVYQCNELGIVAQQFNSVGMPVGNEMLVQSYTTTRHIRPSVAADQSGGYVVAWTELSPAADYRGSVHAQRLRIEPPSDTPVPTSTKPVCPPTATVPPPTATPSSSVTPSLTPTRCPGDCNRNRLVSVDELIFGVRILLGELRLRSCQAMDGDGDGQITVADLVRAVGNALRGCAGTDPA